MKQLKNSKTMQYSFYNNLYRHLEKSIVTIRQLEKQEKRNVKHARQVFDNHANICLMIEREYGAAMLKDLVNYFKSKYDNKDNQHETIINKRL